MASILCPSPTLILRGPLLYPAYNAENATFELDTLVFNPHLNDRPIAIHNSMYDNEDL